MPWATATERPGRVMEIDYGALIPLALQQLYPDAQERERVESLLGTYGSQSWHRERERVALGILYLASKEPEKLESLVELACTDYRDLLCAAEYPYSSADWSLKDRDPDKQKRLQERETDEYLAWVATLRRA